MNNVAILRKIVNNGWTIANRRNIVAQIGKNNFDEIVLNAKKLNITGDIYEFKYTKEYFQPEALTSTKNRLLEKIKLLTSRWENPLQDYIPSFTDASQCSPFHHGLHGSMSSIRSAFNGVRSDNPTKLELFRIEQCLPEVQRIDESLSKMPPLEKDCIVYRGICRGLNQEKTTKIFKIFDECKAGDIITPDSGYSYCAFNKYKTYGYGGCPDKNGIYRTVSQTIRLPKGAKVSRNLEHEGEVLIPRGAEYRVVSKTVEGNHIDITLEYILPKKDNVQEVNELMARYNLKPKPLDELIEAYN